MALNDTLVAFSDGNPIDVLRSYPVLDKPATRALVERLFPGAEIEEIGDELLVDALNPPADVVCIGCFPGLELVCSWGLTPKRPSELDPVVFTATDRRNVYLHAAHSDAGWCSYGVWRDGSRVRARSISADPTVSEDEGTHLPFERPGEESDPGEQSCASMQALFGFACDDHNRMDDVDPELIPVVAYRITTTDSTPTTPTSQNEEPNP
ncbi:DUF6928 family protein [Dactylosporangium matsuzakiense]|uniref:Uncharacterized protein n=1 Tax=Dactylosporangium matsuzakiense TaxID=53360 RepID=A0A9W6NN91_9ACTN|nr:hypothetical protein [Dactylosporangium matsuzakiense]UWZ43486.1 hypothetical protein Dmats_39510 [Dactylosporangium matsuzakiense]GLL02983.1 hypothetical protein GCM10017581_047250 [Dactylosporangium matsuzakiense]